MKRPDPSVYYLGGALLLVLLYFLSPPFVILALGERFLEAHSREVEAFYAAPIWLFKNFPLYRDYIEMVFRLLR